MANDIELTNLIRFAISDDTDERLLRLLREHPEFAESAVALGESAAPLDRVLEWIFVTGLAQFEGGRVH